MPRATQMNKKWKGEEVDFGKRWKQNKLAPTKTWDSFTLESITWIIYSTCTISTWVFSFSYVFLNNYSNNKNKWYTRSKLKQKSWHKNIAWIQFLLGFSNKTQKSDVFSSSVSMTAAYLAILILPYLLHQN